MSSEVPDSVWASPSCFLLWIYSLGSTFSDNFDSLVSSSCLLQTNYPEMQEKSMKKPYVNTFFFPFSKAASLQEMKDVIQMETPCIPLSVFRLTVTNPSSTPCLFLLSRPTTRKWRGRGRERSVWF